MIQPLGDEGLPGLRPDVLILTHVAKLSGAEIALLRWTEHMQRTVNITVIIGEEGQLAEELRKFDCTVIVIPLSTRAREISRSQVLQYRKLASILFEYGSYMRKLRRHIRRNRPDFVQFNTLKAGIYGTFACLGLHRKTIWHVRDRVSRDYLPGGSSYLVKAMLSCATSIVCNSAATASTMPRWCRKRSRVIHDMYAGVDGPQVTRGSRASLNQFPDFVMLGRISPWKGQMVAIEAFAEAFVNETNRLYIVGGALFGEDQYLASLVGRVKELDLTARIVMAGHADDPQVFLVDTRIGIHASTLPEPFGQVIVEYLASGLPVIASDGGGSEEILADGAFGLLVRRGSMRDLSRAMSYLAENRAARAALSERGRQRALDFRPAALAPAWWQLYGSSRET